MDLRNEILQKIDFVTFYRGEVKELGKNNGNGWALGLCCFHEDKIPSLSVNLDTGAFKCFSCDSSGDVFSFYQKKYDCDFKESLKGLGKLAGVTVRKEQSNKQSKKSNGKLVATYTYTDETGKPLHRTVKTDQKDFYQEQFKEGKWVKGLNGITLKLYNLPKVTGSPDIYFPEGEKDCQALEKLGFCASCNPMGAGKLPGQQEKYSILDPLRNKRVFAIPDLDEPGIDHVRDLTTLIYGKAKEVRIVELPGLSEGGDVSDFIQKHGEKAKRKIIELTALAPAWTPPKEKGQSLDFPDVIDGVAGEFTKLLCKYIEAPPQFLYMSFFTCLGIITSGYLTLKTIHKPQPRFYTLLLGPSGESRKSTTINQTIEFFRSTLTSEFDLNICHGVGSDIGLLKKLKKNSSLLLVLDEFKSLTSKSSIKGSNLLPAISTLFDKNAYENQTKTQAISIENVHLSILGASTPETYESTWESEFTSIGLNNRLWIVPGDGERGQAFPPEIPNKEYMPVKKGLGNILSLIGESLNLDLTPEAKALYAQWYDNKENSIHSQRLEAYAFKLMCLLTVNELKVQVDKGIIEKVIALCDWQLQARKLYTPVDADNVIAKMEEKIRRVLDVRGSLTERELFNFTNAKRVGRYYFKNALKNLVEGDEVELNKKTKKHKLKV